MILSMEWQGYLDTLNAGRRIEFPEMASCLAELFWGKSPGVALPCQSSVHVIWANYDNLTQSHCKGCFVRESFPKVGELL